MWSSPTCSRWTSVPLPRAWACPSCALRADRKSTRLNSSHSQISYAVFCLKKKNLSLAALPPPTTKYWTSGGLAGLPPTLARSDPSQSGRGPLRVLIAEDSQDEAQLRLPEP